MSVKILDSGSVSIDGVHIEMYRLMTLRRGIMLESKGMRLSRGRSCLSIVKSEFGWKGSRAKILEKLDEIACFWD
jgi:hypothetical protein